MPYSEAEEYVFVSHFHADRDVIFPVLAKLQRAGRRIWYDEGIKGVESWRKILTSKIESNKCVNFLLLNFEKAVSSIFVRAEITAALNCEKRIVTVRLDEARFSLDLEMYLQILQTLDRKDVAFDEEIIKAIDQRSFVLNQG